LPSTPVYYRAFWQKWESGFTAADWKNPWRSKQG